jgi:hypothetical protein
MTLPTVTVAFAGTDQTCAVVSGTIRHGRDDPGSQPVASVASLDLLGPIPAGVDIGTAVTVTAHLGGTAYPRFAGRVTDLGVAWEDVDTPLPQLIAAGALSDMGRKVVGDAPWPEENDGTRVNRIIGLAGVPTDAARTDPGYIAVLARDVDAQPALDVATDAAIAGDGIVWQAKDGAVLYADVEHRRTAPIALELGACDLPGSLVWKRSLEGLVNDVRIRYGATPAGGEQPEVRYTDPASIAARGTFAASLSTQLANAGAATNRATYTVTRQAEPVWILEGLRMALEWITTPGLSAALLGLEMHALASVTGMPAGSPYTSALVFIEGWTETLEPAEDGSGVGSWLIEFATSDFCRSQTPPRWDVVDPAITWDTIGAGYTWDTIRCLPPSTARGRWHDVPASLRWDQVPAATSWDTWAG